MGLNAIPDDECNGDVSPIIRLDLLHQRVGCVVYSLLEQALGFYRFRNEAARSQDEAKDKHTP